MNSRNAFLVSATLALAARFVTSALAAQPDRIVVSGLVSPESVVHDPLTDVYLVSNVGGPPVIFNHGFISRVSPQGDVLDLKWIEDGVNGATLHGPKGLFLHRGELYVVDIDTLRIFNRFTGAPIRDVPIPNPFAAAGTMPSLGTPGALFLNHAVVTRDGTVYISDQLNSAIFKVDAQGNSSVLAAGPQLANPDGILLDEDELTWVTFFGHEVRRMTSSGKIIMEAPLPPVDVTGLTLGPNPLPPGALMMDGYAFWHGSLLVTSWVTGSVYRIGRSGTEIQTVAQVVSSRDNPARPDGPAKISIDYTRGRLLLPLFNAGQLVILSLPD
jgi:hypothetical protein